MWIKLIKKKIQKIVFILADLKYWESYEHSLTHLTEEAENEEKINLIY